MKLTHHDYNNTHSQHDEAHQDNNNNAGDYFVKALTTIKDTHNKKRLATLEELTGTVKDIADDKFSNSSGNLIGLVGRTEAGREAVREYEEKKDRLDGEAGEAVRDAQRSLMADVLSGGNRDARPAPAKKR